MPKPPLHHHNKSIERQSPDKPTINLLTLAKPCNRITILHTPTHPHASSLLSLFFEGGLAELEEIAPPLTGRTIRLFSSVGPSVAVFDSW